MKTILMRNLEIGTGSPKVIVPIVGQTRKEILFKARELTGIPLHVVEWRVDFYQDVYDLTSVLSTLLALRESLGDFPILFTFRTKRRAVSARFQRSIIPSLTWRWPSLEM